MADGVLDAVRSAIKHFPVDLDPRVAILLGARDLATAALDVAKEAIKGLEDLEGFLKKALDALADALGKTLGHSINIKEAAFEGDLRGIIEHDDPVDLILKADFFGGKLNEKFAFKMKDLPWSLEQLSLMGLYALEPPYAIQIRGIRTTFPPPRELYPLCSHPMA